MTPLNSHKRMMVLGLITLWLCSCRSTQPKPWSKTTKNRSVQYLESKQELAFSLSQTDTKDIAFRTVTVCRGEDTACTSEDTVKSKHTIVFPDCGLYQVKLADCQQDQTCHSILTMDKSVSTCSQEKRNKFKKLQAVRQSLQKLDQKAVGRLRALQDFAKTHDLEDLVGGIS